MPDEPQPPAIIWIERVIVGCVLLIALFAPHSIAVTQTAWLLGMVLWVGRSLMFPRPQFFRTPIDYLLLGFFIVSGVSSVLSYAPIVSIGKMRAASLFTIFYLTVENIRSLRPVRILAIAIVASCMINVVATAARFGVGKGVKIAQVSNDSPLRRAIFRSRTTHFPTPIQDGDTIWEIDGTRVTTPEELAANLAATSDQKLAQMKIFRLEWTPTVEIERGHLLPGTTAERQLGISGWSRGRDWRATGFFGHYVTYAEVLQLIASLAFGMLLALQRKWTSTGALLAFAVVGLLFALSLTATRASWVGFAASASLMLLIFASRRTVAFAGLLAIPLILGGIFLLREKRSVGLFDSQDLSTTWRTTVWREGFGLLISKPRHLLVGIGMDSIKAHWREWRLFDQGRLPIGHMHSDMLQVALERGVPALLLWLATLGAYAMTLWRTLKLIPKVAAKDEFLWIDRGIVLGALGGLLGFFVSGLVHYNWGDSEVVMILYFLMGLSLIINRQYRVDATVRAERRCE
ncbi:MAG: O-antigen ligase family protein [Pyrinomonadaceae bacterium]